MLRLSVHRSKSAHNAHARAYASAPPAPSPDGSVLSTLRVRLRESAHQPGALADLRQSSLYRECYEWGQRQAQCAARKTDTDRSDPSARNAAAVQTICYTLDAYIDFCRHYDASPTSTTAPDLRDGKGIEQAFLKQIRSQHRSSLLARFQESLHANADERRAAVLSALDVRLLDALCSAGIVSLASLSDEVQVWRNQSHPSLALNEAELLAVVDYLNSATGTFNAINGAAITSAYYGEHTLQSRVSVFSAALASAINKLCDHPYFARRNIVCYKGIRLSALDAPFRLAALNDACAKRGLIAFPNVLSASCDPEQSYARKKYEEGYTLECMITMQRGFYADPFHDTSTMGEHEILGPANQRFRVTSKSSFKVFEWQGEKPQEADVDRYEMKPADL